LKHPYKPGLEQHIKDWWNRRSGKWNKVFQKAEQVAEHGGELFDW